MIDIRDNAIVGMINFEDAMVPASLHFSEWWNGEGMDINFTNDLNKTISLHSDEIEALVVAAKIIGLIDFKSIKKRVKQVQKEVNVRKQHLQNVRDEIFGKRDV